MVFGAGAHFGKFFVEDVVNGAFAVHLIAVILVDYGERSGRGEGVFASPLVDHAVAVEAVGGVGRGADVAVHEGPCRARSVGRGGVERCGGIVVGDPQVPAPEYLSVGAAGRDDGVAACARSGHGDDFFLLGDVIDVLNQIFGVLPDEFGSDGIADAFGRGVAFVLRVEHDRAARFYDVAVCGSGGGEIDRIFGDLYLRFPPPSFSGVVVAAGGSDTHAQESCEFEIGFSYHTDIG